MRSTLFEHFEQLGTLVGLASAALLILSVFYDFSFLLALGLTFDEVPTSISDHVRSAIVWAPKVGSMALALYMYELFMRRVENGRTEAELIASSPTPRFTKTLRASADTLIPIIGGLFVAASLVFGTSLTWLYIGFLLAWGFLSLSVVHHPRMGARFSRAGGRLFVMVPLVIAGVGGFGYERGRQLLTSTTAHWAVTVKTEHGVESRLLTGLRRFNGVAIAVDLKKAVSVLPADSLLVASSILPTDADVPHSCKWFGYLCPTTRAEQRSKPSNLPLQGTSAGGRP